MQAGNFVLDSTSFTGVPQGSPNGFTLFNGLAFADPATLSFPATAAAGGNCSVISGTVTTPNSTVPQQACCYNVTQFKVRSQLQACSQMQLMLARRPALPIMPRMHYSIIMRSICALLEI